MSVTYSSFHFPCEGLLRIVSGLFDHIPFAVLGICLLCHFVDPAAPRD